MLSLNVAIEAFDAHGLRGQNERMLDVGDIVTILGSLYETISVSGCLMNDKDPQLMLSFNFYEVQISLLLKTQSLRIKFALISFQPSIRLKDTVSILKIKKSFGTKCLSPSTSSLTTVIRKRCVEKSYVSSDNHCIGLVAWLSLDFPSMCPWT